MSFKTKREKIIEFKKLYLEYLNLDRQKREELGEHAWMLGGAGEDDLTEDGERITEVRSELNRAIPVVDSYVSDIGEPTSVWYAPPPAIGGWSGQVGLFSNLFNKNYKSLTQQTLDTLDRAIGRYDYHIANRWKNLVNPLYWLGRLLHLPFRILQIAGFDGNKAEASLPGKIIKTLLAVLTAFVTVHKAWEAYKEDVRPWVDRAMRPTASASPSPTPIPTSKPPTPALQ